VTFTFQLFHRLQTKVTRNALDCEQSNYSSSTVFSYIPIVFGPTLFGISAIRFSDRENYTLEPNQSNKKPLQWILLIY